MFRSFATSLIVAITLSSLTGCSDDKNWGRTHDVQMVAMAPQAGGPWNAEVPDLNIADQQEVQLVEQINFHRDAYKKTLTQLRAYYGERGKGQKQRWADEELSVARNIEQVRYITKGEIPAPQPLSSRPFRSRPASR